MTWGAYSLEELDASLLSWNSSNLRTYSALVETLPPFMESSLEYAPRAYLLCWIMTQTTSTSFTFNTSTGCFPPLSIAISPAICSASVSISTKIIKISTSSPILFLSHHLIIISTLPLVDLHSMNHDLHSFVLALHRSNVLIIHSESIYQY